MAVRTTYAQVILIIEVDSTITSDLAPFIEVANALVTELCTDSGYDATRLELVERWLSAHFYAIRDVPTNIKSQKAGAVGRSFDQKVDLLLNQTRWGQMAMLVDTDGNLAALNEEMKKGGKRTVGVTWAGTGDSDGNDTTGDDD